MASISRKRSQKFEQEINSDDDYSDSDATPRTKGDTKPRTSNANASTNTSNNTSTNTNTNTQASKSTTKSTPTPASRKVAGSKEALRNSLEDTGAFMLLLILDITKMVLQLMKQPIAFVLVLYILIVMVSYTASYIASLVIAGLSPLCSLPLATMLPVCQRIQLQQTRVQEPRYPELVDLQTRFENVMDSVSLGSNLALDIKNSEMAVRDLNTLVKLSNIVSKDLLSSSLDDFVASAKEASRYLSRLDSGVGGAVDSILAMDDYAIKTLEAIEKQQKSQSIISSALFPFSNHAMITRKKLIETFNQATGLLENNLRRLIESSVATTSILSQLESQLLVIHEIVSREELNIKSQKDEVLADLWTYLGANRKQLANFAEHRGLLAQVATYRSAAAVQVGGTLVQLEKLASDLDDLRERVAIPVLIQSTSDSNDPRLSSGASIPLEVHIMTLRKGVERLSEGRGRAKLREEKVLKRMMEGPQYPELGSR